ncbi:MAG: hypothetical protein K2N72_01650 [Oscillospiraceae bacterium]|nr:hypothetical protein [Oscillospiraceae bacterium]
MIIGGVNNYNRVQTSRSKQANARSLSSFCEMLNKSANKDTFSTESISKPTTSTNKLDFLSIEDTGTKLNNISAAIKDTDYSGMTKAEIYADIEKKYEDAFDDFYISISTAICTDHIMVSEHFENELRNQEIELNMDLYKEARGYTGMSYDEMEAAIKEKYAGKTGFFDQLNLFGELYRSGILDNKYGSHEAFVIMSHFSLSLECGGDIAISKSEWISRIKQTGASSPFSLFLNFPYFSESTRDFYKSVVDDILFGDADKKK